VASRALEQRQSFALIALIDDAQKTIGAARSGSSSTKSSISSGRLSIGYLISVSTPSAATSAPARGPCQFIASIEEQARRKEKFVVFVKIN